MTRQLYNFESTKMIPNTNKNAFQSMSHLPLANRKSNTYILTIYRASNNRKGKKNMKIGICDVRK